MFCVYGVVKLMCYICCTGVDCCHIFQLTSLGARLPLDLGLGNSIQFKNTRRETGPVPCYTPAQVAESNKLYSQIPAGGVHRACAHTRATLNARTQTHTPHTTHNADTFKNALYLVPDSCTRSLCSYVCCVYSAITAICCGTMPYTCSVMTCAPAVSHPCHSEC